MEKYCCFLHPKEDYNEKTLEEACPDCNRVYGFPLNEEFMPKKIGEYNVIKSLGRGYYGATYVVEKQTNIRTKKLVLKVVPVEIYKFFNKNFEEECKLHAEAAEGTQHIVNIDDVFETDIEFGDVTLRCHVAILDYIGGDTLKYIIENKVDLSAASIGQIAIDLLKILSELQVKKLFHNDLHPGNIMIQKIKDDQKRTGELDDTIKAVAIDFGSLNKRTQSGGKSERKGDLHWIAQTLNALSQKILDNPVNIEERDFRLASLLEERARILFPRVTSQRIYEFEEVINQIRNVFVQVDSPWKETLSLRNFKDSYNAQTLAPWFVPSLLVDDDDKWISAISNRGPQVITGMRGCGKTMLLRALQFHARAIPQDKSEINEQIVTRLKNEGYLGLYVSCTRLLDKQGEQDKPIHEPFARLFVAYGLEAINALRHLRELDRTSVRPDSFSFIAKVISDFIEGASKLRELSGEHEIEKFLKDVLNSLSKGESRYTINTNPANTFPQLALAIRQCSHIWNNQYVFFLLDDVSTRFLNESNIIKLVSTLLFQNEFCSFKFTTEAQTLEMVINSPGNIEHAREGRDYDIFDLGDEVNEKVHSVKSEGIAFVEKILFKRAKFHSSHPKNLTPSDILGDSTLQVIAENIAKPGKASEKKGIYHGITAIASVCVGDIGDVITLYEMILKRRSGNVVSPHDQNECYLELCRSRLYDINRKDPRLFDFAESFSEAAHFLLVQSYNKSKDNKKERLRQYYSIFINITDGDVNKQYEQVRELIDAGIFNFSGGPEASRTNRQGLNPQQQFKLTFRKLYGVSKHIGLSNSDRFELSGEYLEDWLNNPKKGKEILIRNLKNKKGPDEKEEIGSLDSVKENKSLTAYQKSIFDDVVKDLEEDIEEQKEIEKLAKEKTPISMILSLEQIIDSNISKIMIGMGFEESTLESFRRVLKINPKSVLLMEFKEKGKTDAILKILNKTSIDISKITYTEALDNNILYGDQTFFDITGFPQSIVFNSIKNSLIKDKKVFFAYTEAEIYYPLDSDIEALLNKYQKDDQTQFLESLTDILKGEKGPYKLIPLLPKEINPSARRVLIAFSSPKHERLYSLLDEREYDKIHLIVPSGDSPRNKLARIAAEVAIRKFNHAEIKEFDSDNLQDIMEYLSIQYQNYFVNQNFSFELAITGSKLQTVASAAICAIYKVNQCWYVQPSEWDSNRFTKGVGQTKIYSIDTNKV